MELCCVGDLIEEARKVGGEGPRAVEDHLTIASDVIDVSLHVEFDHREKAGARGGLRRHDCLAGC